MSLLKCIRLKLPPPNGGCFKQAAPLFLVNLWLPPPEFWALSRRPIHEPWQHIKGSLSSQLPYALRSHGCLPQSLGLKQEASPWATAMLLGLKLPPHLVGSLSRQLPYVSWSWGCLPRGWVPKQAVPSLSYCQGEAGRMSAPSPLWVLSKILVTASKHSQSPR